MSKHSPGVVENSELLTIFIFHPMQQLDKNGRAKPNVLSHVKTRGRSIQRDDIASDQEITTFVRKFLENGEDRIWKGVLQGGCQDVRNIRLDNDKQAVCVYDTANSDNISHGELFLSRQISEADEVEVRGELFTAFNGGVISLPTQYRNGAVWTYLPTTLQARG